MAKKGMTRREMIKTAALTPAGALLAAYLKADVSTAEGKRLNRQLIVKALTDPAFRTQLELNPRQAIKRTPTKANLAEINRLLAKVRELDSSIQMMADELLCACSVTAAPRN